MSDTVVEMNIKSYSKLRKGSIDKQERLRQSDGPDETVKRRVLIGKGARVKKWNGKNGKKVGGVINNNYPLRG